MVSSSGGSGSGSSLSWQSHLIASLKLAWPNVLTTLVQLAIPVVSSLALGHIGDPIYLGSAALGNMFANATGFAVGSGLSMALDTLCSQAYGAKKYKLVGLQAQRAMVILTFMCVPIALLWYYAGFLLQYVGTAQTADLSQFWLRRLIPCIWPRLMYDAYRRYLLGQRIVWPITASVIIVSIVHAITTYLFVFYFEWGFVGAVYATNVSYWVLFLSLLSISYARLFYLRRKVNQRGRHVPLVDMMSVTAAASPSLMSKKLSSLSMDENENDDDDNNLSASTGDGEDDGAIPENEHLVVHTPSTSNEEEDGLTDIDIDGDDDDKKMKSVQDGAGDDGDSLHTWPAWSLDVFRGWGMFMKLGVATSISLVIEWGSFEVNAVIASRLGDVPLAAHAILANVASLWYSAPAGMASATTALVGNSLGAGEPERAALYARIGYGLQLVFSIVNGGLGMAYRNVLGKMYTDDEELIAMVAGMVWVMWIYGIVDSLKCVGMAVLRGAGRPTLTVYGNVISCIVIGYSLAYVFVFHLHWGLHGLWLSMTCAWLVAMSIYGTVIARTDWNKEVQNATERNIKGMQSMKQGYVNAAHLNNSNDDDDTMSNDMVIHDAGGV
eukprot:TRINITY_DN4965_c0_g1_i5.p1 TRINITY_DN4965_c0_g1~~TRINITY_DN4965_c0_g1_i5.p1  ORF type:complete len:609 (+),score=100.02 TRINITY_DN4965_c0_g1_i5:80-1906(+)